MTPEQQNMLMSIKRAVLTNALNAKNPEDACRIIFDGFCMYHRYVCSEGIEHPTTRPTSFLQHSNYFAQFGRIMGFFLEQLPLPDEWLAINSEDLPESPPSAAELSQVSMILSPRGVFTDEMLESAFGVLKQFTEVDVVVRNAKRRLAALQQEPRVCQDAREVTMRSMPHKSSVHLLVDEFDGDVEHQQSLVARLNELGHPVSSIQDAASLDLAALRDRCLRELNQFIHQNERRKGMPWSVGTSRQVSLLLLDLKTSLTRLGSVVPDDAACLIPTTDADKMAALSASLLETVDAFSTDVNHAKMNPDLYNIFKQTITATLARYPELNKPDSMFKRMYDALVSCIRAFFRIFDVLLHLGSKQTWNDTPGRQPFIKPAEPSFGQQVVALKEQFEVTIKKIDDEVNKITKTPPCLS